MADPVPNPAPAGSAPARRLEALLATVAAGGLRALSEDEVLELGRAYRRTAALLARARTAGSGGGDVQHLNRLLARAYPLVHAHRAGPRTSVLNFVLHEFPQAVRREGRFILAATLFFLVGVFAGALLVEMDPDMPDVLLGPGWKQGLQGLAERHMGNEDWMPASIRPQTSLAIIFNNVRVSFLAFASGLPLCLGSVYVLGFNGVMLGAVGVVVHRNAVDLDFWSFVAPHGVTELTAIMIAGGAGLVMGYALLAPGRLTRKTALREAGRRAAPLVMGVVVMLLVAGLIEGFVSPVPELPPSTKLLFSGLTAVVLTAWFSLGGRPRS